MVMATGISSRLVPRNRPTKFGHHPVSYPRFAKIDRGTAVPKNMETVRGSTVRSGAPLLEYGLADHADYVTTRHDARANQ